MDFSTSLPLDGKLRVNLSVLFFPRTVYTNGSNSIVSPFHFLCGRGTRRSRRSPSSAQAARRDCIRRWLLPRLDRSQLRCRSECKRPRSTKHGQFAADLHGYLLRLFRSGLGISSVKAPTPHQGTSDGNFWGSPIVLRVRHHGHAHCTYHRQQFRVYHAPLCRLSLLCIDS
jgi:hypothetical protein